MMKIGFEPIRVLHHPFRNRDDIEPDRNTLSRGLKNVKGELCVYRKSAAASSVWADWT